MAIYGIGVTPLINMLTAILSNEYSVNVNVMAYADDFSAARNLQNLRRWWSALTEIGPKFGYYPNPTKTWLVVKGCVHSIFASFFLSLNESTCQTRKNVFYFTSKALFVLEKIKF